jgi:CPA1 family monovalent cation:H+ antiporter
MAFSHAFTPLIQGATQGAGIDTHTSEVVTLVGAFVGLLVISAIVDAIARRLKIPFTVALVVAGAVLGTWAERWSFLAPIGSLEVTPDAVFFVFLPTLIFQSAFHLDARALRANLAPTLALAVPGLLVSTGLIGAIMKAVGGGVGLPLTWPEALLLGSILSATDPVAVISLFSQLGAPKRLTVLVEGESLFNDATAIVLSRIILGVIAAGTFSSAAILDGAVEFGAVFFGGLLVGAALALLAGFIIGQVRNDAFIEITVTTVLAYLSFYVAEHSLHLSGVMAVVAAGVLIGGWGKTKISPAIAKYLEHFWDYVAGVANALIFLLVGLTVHVNELVDALPILVWVIAAMLVSRALVIFTLVPLSGRISGTRPISRSYQAVMYWGGLRGGIALAIALALPETLPDKDLFVTIATGAVLFTLIVQGLTIERVVKHFRLHIPPMADQLARIESRIAGKLRALDAIPQLQAGGLFPPRIAKDLREKTDGELAELRKELAGLHERELDGDLERRILYLRSFGTEKTRYFEMFGEGHLSEGAYRDLIHSVDLQTDAIRYEGELPVFTLHPPRGERFSASLLRDFGRVPGLGGLVERAREAAAARDYEVAWARFHCDTPVIEDLERVDITGTHRPRAMEEVLTSYRYWRESAKARLDETAELFPEFVAATQERLAGRLALQAEHAAIEERAHSGAVPHGLSVAMLDEVDAELAALRTAPASKLVVDPEELLRKVPFFQGLPREEFAQVARSLHQRTAPSGDTIVRQGERGSSLFLVARGVVRVIRTDGDTDRPIATLLAGDFFGEMALLHGGTRTATCRAVTPCALYELARADIDAVLASCPAMRGSLEEADRVRRAELKDAGADLG